MNTKQRNNRCKQLKKQLKEHDYATTYDLFEPLPYIQYFINRTTSEQTLDTLIRAAKSSTAFTLDTESIGSYKQQNKPALIQLQMIFSYHSSLIMIIEMYHLPRQNHPCFTLIQELFRIIFTHGKSMYIWGSNQELFPFVEFKLFTNEQIKLMTYCNLQDDFKCFWIQHHPHQTNSNKCLCESCLGHGPSHLWSLQDSIALELNEYLPKTLTNERFNIGLDPNLHSHDHGDNQYCQELTTYAMNDVSSMQRLINRMKQQRFEFKFRSKLSRQSDTRAFTSIIELEQDSDDDNDDIFLSEITPTNRIITTSRYSNEEQLIVPELPGPTNQTITTPTHPESPESLSQEERRRLHNRSCTLRQRRRQYKTEIILNNVDPRFSIKRMKKYLRDRSISISATNMVESKFSNNFRLFIGIEDPTKKKYYEQILKNCFTTEHYTTLRRYRHDQHRYRHNQHQHQHQHRYRHNQHQQQHRHQHNQHRHQSDHYHNWNSTTRHHNRY